MRGDETQPALAKGGPRHAAPRKSLLNRIQGPAGKAMALAAMPTAVFVGMGLTPKIALADDKDIPFAPGPCVTRSDEPTPEASETEKEKETAKPTATPSATATASPSATPSATAAPTPTATGQTTTQRKLTTTTAPKPAATPTTTAAPTPAKSKNPLDPLGLGDALKDLFDGPDPKPTATPTTAAPTTQAPTTAPKTSTAPKTATVPKATVAPKATGAAKPAVDPAAKPAADPAAEKKKAAIREAAEKAGAAVEELPESAKGLDAKKDEDIPEGAKPRFPCPERDDAALAAAELEPGIPLLPDEPWVLESTKLDLLGLKYHGIVEVKTYGGKIKKVLKFTASSVVIKDLHQITAHSEGRKAHVRSLPANPREAGPSTITGGTVTMYTEELKGNIFGLPFVRVTFSPESPPPLDIPLVWFTDVKIKQAGQFGGTLKIPGLHNTIEPG
ncbi:hypothetical protein [Streptomyces sp. NPDC086147]|uniref:hypothetical protein n=1 Tax=Streptomyces sp. NPDC086147 TaxID=3155295 RepID=UPI00344EA804